MNKTMKDGDWHSAKGLVLVVCPECHEDVKDSPTVAYYRAEWDYGRMQAQMHSGWAITKWLAWWQCGLCHNNWFEVVSADIIADWGRKLGGWQEAKQ